MGDRRADGVGILADGRSVVDAGLRAAEEDADVQRHHSPDGIGRDPREGGPRLGCRFEAEGAGEAEAAREWTLEAGLAKYPGGVGVTEGETVDVVGGVRQPAAKEKAHRRLRF